MAIKRITPLPPEDVQTFFETMKAAISRGAQTPRIAQDQAFTELRRKGGLWEDKPYGPSSAKMFVANFTEAQQAEIRSFFPAMSQMPREHVEPRTVRELFEKNPDKAKSFLASVLKDPTRARLAVEFDVDLGTVSIVLEKSIEGLYKHITGKPVQWGNHYLIPAKKMSDGIARIEHEYPELAGLSSMIIPQYVTQGKNRDRSTVLQLADNSWVFPIPQEEQDLYQNLKAKADKAAGRTIRAEDVPINSSFAGAPGNRTWDQRIGDDHIGEGHRIRG